MRLKKNDMVMVMTGKAKGKVGKVLQIFWKEERALVEKVNLVKKHQKPTSQNKQGGIIEKEAPIHLSNLMPLDPKDKKPTRVRAKFLKDGEKVRVACRSGEAL